MFLLGTAFGDWWGGLTALQNVMFVIACTTTLIFLVQLVLSLIGIGDDASFDLDTDLSDVDGDIFNDEAFSSLTGLKLLSFRTIMAFLCVGSWTIFAFNFFLAWYFAATIGIVLGAAVAVAVAFLVRGLYRMQSSGNIVITNAVGKIADVYLRIPAQRGGSGKVTLVVQDSLIEREAVTDYLEDIKTGEKVKIIEALSPSLLLVDPLNVVRSGEKEKPVVAGEAAEQAT